VFAGAAAKENANTQSLLSVMEMAGLECSNTSS
jgi:hypothetical protein